MNSLNRFRKCILTGAALLALATFTATAADKKDDKKPAPIPDKMTTCPVSGDKLGEMGKPYVFEYKGREVKLCCPDCKKDFDKEPAKYMKKIVAADKTSDKAVDKDTNKDPKK
jgi:YHS domain-containing protein